jgi:hypothetical protein
MEVMTILMVYIVLVAFLIWVCVVSDPNSDSLGKTFVSGREGERPHPAVALPGH